METKNKSLFTRQMGMVMVLCLACILFSGSCQTTSEDGQALSDEQIAFNLLEDGTTDPELLIGEWSVIAFAYTADGKKISDVTDISDLGFGEFGAEELYAMVAGWYAIEIKDNDPVLFFSDAPSGLIGPLSFGVMNHFYLLSGNLISYYRSWDSTFGILLPESDEVRDVKYALTHTYSFTIKGDALTIHFTGKENKNLLLLKRLIKGKS